MMFVSVVALQLKSTVLIVNVLHKIALKALCKTDIFPIS